MIKELIQEWAKRDGSHIVKARLIERRLSTSFVDKLIGNRYNSPLRGSSLTILEDELRKAGFLQEKTG